MGVDRDEFSSDDPNSFDAASAAATFPSFRAAGL